jgi:DNA-binding XRE family transcriptional regulator
MTMGEHMRAARKRAGLTRPKLSKLSGVNVQTIYVAENDRCYTSIFNTICLADALGISIDEYIGRKV